MAVPVVVVSAAAASVPADANPAFCTAAGADAVAGSVDADGAAVCARPVPPSISAIWTSSGERPSSDHSRTCTPSAWSTQVGSVPARTPDAPAASVGTGPVSWSISRSLQSDQAPPVSVWIWMRKSLSGKPGFQVTPTMPKWPVLGALSRSTTTGPSCGAADGRRLPPRERGAFVALSVVGTSRLTREASARLLCFWSAAGVAVVVRAPSPRANHGCDAAPAPSRTVLTAARSPAEAVDTAGVERTTPSGPASPRLAARDISRVRRTVVRPDDVD